MDIAELKIQIDVLEQTVGQKREAILSLLELAKKVQNIWEGHNQKKAAS